GRGAPLILPPASTLRVRLMAAEKDRIAYISRHFALPEAEAAKWVKQTDHDRDWFVQEHFIKNPADPANYDLVLNMSRFSAEAAAQIVTVGLRQLIGVRG